jgi:hypothetical protein
MRGLQRIELKVATLLNAESRGVLELCARPGLCVPRELRLCLPNDCSVPVANVVIQLAKDALQMAGSENLDLERAYATYRQQMLATIAKLARNG